MDAYFDFCENFKEALAIYQQKGYRQWIPELCMTVYLDNKNIKRRELYGLRLHILRMNGDNFQINSDKNFSDNRPLCFYRGSIELCSKILPTNSTVIKKNSSQLIKKYMSWIDEEADDALLEQYAEVYNGIWIGVLKVKRLAAKGNGNPLFSSNVMKNFFEEVMRNAKYGKAKKILLAFILTAYGGYRFFFIRVLKKIIID